MTANITVLQRCHYDATVRYPVACYQGQQALSRASPLLIKRSTINKLAWVMRQRAETRLVPREGTLKQRRRHILITTRGALIRTSHEDRNPHRRYCHRRWALTSIQLASRRKGSGFKRKHISEFRAILLSFMSCTQFYIAIELNIFIDY